jgi:hypothetical protein
MVSDYITHEFDYSDCDITVAAFDMVCEAFKLWPDVDCLASVRISKCEKYFRAPFSPGCVGFDAFAYEWKTYGICWIVTEKN